MPWNCQLHNKEAIPVQITLEGAGAGGSLTVTLRPFEVYRVRIAQPPYQIAAVQGRVEISIFGMGDWPVRGQIDTLDKV